jgi:MoxR-like ATPase
MLEQIGLYGLERIENAVLAGLVTGDPLLLIGSHGSGKTLLCSRLAKALGLNFWAYDAGKALFEDVLGFPNPASKSSGQVEYVPTPISIWGKEFVLIDELSRANPSMQNKWLEVIRSRKIMGKEVRDLKYIFAAMNPPSYLGAHPLDAALAGRFAIIVQVPEVSEMPEAAVSRIVSQISEDDAPMLKSPRRDPQGTMILTMTFGVKKSVN